MIRSVRVATIMLTVAAALSVAACATTPPVAAPAAGGDDPTPDATSSASPTPTPEPLPAIDEGLISSETLCVAMAAADLDLLSTIGVTSASTLSTDQAGDNGRCYISDAPDSISVVLDFSANLAGTDEWLQRTWPGPCVGESRAEILVLGGYETALSYCTEYPIEGDEKSARHFTAVATTPGGGVDCRLSWTERVVAVDPDIMIDLCTQAFRRLNGTAA